MLRAHRFARNQTRLLAFLYMVLSGLAVSRRMALEHVRLMPSLERRSWLVQRLTMASGLFFAGSLCVRYSRRSTAPRLLLTWRWCNRGRRPRLFGRLGGLEIPRQRGIL